MSTFLKTNVLLIDIVYNLTEFSHKFRLDNYNKLEFDQEPLTNELSKITKISKIQFIISCQFYFFESIVCILSNASSMTINNKRDTPSLLDIDKSKFAL